MPIYEYRCDHCGHELEAFQKVGEPPPAACPACAAERLRKKISPVAFRLKGAGWYETDFKSDKQRNLLKEGDEGKQAGEAKEAAGKEGAGKEDAAKDAAKKGEGKQGAGQEGKQGKEAKREEAHKEKAGQAPAGKSEQGESSGKRQASGSAQSAGRAAAD